MTLIIRTLLTLSYVRSLALAQTSNSSSLENCPRPIQNIGNGRTNFNSTGSRPFRLTPDQENDWYLSYALTDVRGETINIGSWVTMQDLSVYISVPQSLIGTRQGNNTMFCMYMMPGQNDTVTYSGDDASRSCTGVLSDNCLRALRSTPPPAEDDCPKVDISAACGFNTVVGRAAPSNFSDPTCTVDGIPHVNLPDGYRTYGGFVGTGILPPDPERDSFEVYGLRVRQPIPMLITSRVGGSDDGQAEVICLAPENVTEGSRHPEGDFPSAAVGAFSSGKYVLGTFIVACVTALLLA
ncbi:hypothetical protein EsH8_IX_000225 [Colletotrichum jinshuiense]